MKERKKERKKESAAYRQVLAIAPMLISISFVSFKAKVLEPISQTFYEFKLQL
jgi:hypothetical protein